MTLPFRAAARSACAAALLAAPAAAQEHLPRVWQSPRATLTQVVGITAVTVDYGRPAVRGRPIWGALVPYGEVWRAGANENTTVAFQHDVTVEGRPLAAGTYGLHLLPTEDAWTAIFSRNSTSWGSFFHDPAEDALRVTVRPVPAPFRERLTFDFTAIGEQGATLVLWWEELAVPLRIETDTHAHVVAYARDVFLRGVEGFRWQGWNEAAGYCLRNDVELEQGLRWADESIARGSNFRNLSTRAGLLFRLGRHDEGEATMERATAFATEQELNAYGYQLLAGQEVERALAVFRAVVAGHPASWNAHDSLGEALAVAGRLEEALAAYAEALARAPADQHERIRGALDELRRRAAAPGDREDRGG